MPDKRLPKGVFLTGDRIVIKEEEEIIFYKIIKSGNSVNLVCVGNLDHGQNFKMPDELYNKISSKLFDVRHALIR
ncbi:hypothetical protein KKC83_05600 [Patescibacteria group bacterium]|nr:hypothetical protein [Candidatus Falkowbacteria bacterium]MBU3905876.1 hypothetical protein [Patescibacteria group bacterium]MBU4015761.1 hypothetical protein [Patescibacteria group bacterium]MBU4026990.1 hypothetical protein [Patescibacteria group bacterium]MBU4072775.1 hypothetical protein [Patescibacteria group bacterium]